MRGLFFSFALGALTTIPVYAVNGTVNGEPGQNSSEKIEKLDSAVVSASRAGKSTPVTFTMIGKKDLRSANPMNSLPEILSLQPSVVTYNEGGTGLGNSAMTIRGIKGSQINVTLNGITLNDPESQEVFWVNIPSLQSLISSVQLQRGLGTSANGSGAFGASINMSTASVSQEPTGSFDFSTGSYGTYITSVSASTGLTKSGVYASGAYSKAHTDGYIRNGKVNSQSAFVAIGWLKGNNSLRFTYLMGDQKSGITWDGIDYKSWDGSKFDESANMYAIDRRYNGSGKYKDEFGNVHYYDNSIDKYTQHHLQLNYARQFGERITWSTTLNYTRGDGYDEYYKSGKKFAGFGFPSEMTGVDGNAYSKSDFIYRKNKMNDLYVFDTNVKYVSEILNITAGVDGSYFEGWHDSDMLWVKALGDNYDLSSFNDKNSWYYNDAFKKDVSAYVRAEYTPVSWLTAYADLQYRHIGFTMRGTDDDFANVGYDNKWDFFNPRAGVTFNINDHYRAYASAALGHREPGRSDVQENVKEGQYPIKPEKMVDIEIGYNYSSEKFSGSANLYMMEYRDILIENGKLTPSGYKLKENVPHGYRRGVELAISYKPVTWFRLDANATFSINKLKDYTSYVQVYDGATEFETMPFNYGKTTMLMSPSTVSFVRLTFKPFADFAGGSLKTTTLAVDGKYVGKQYIDNTMREGMEIPAYAVANLSLNHEFNVRSGVLGLGLYVNNLLNNKYFAAGWRWEGYTKATDTLIYGTGVYPQAETNFMLKLSYRF